MVRRGADAASALHVAVPEETMRLIDESLRWTQQNSRLVDMTELGLQSSQDHHRRTLVCR